MYIWEAVIQDVVMVCDLKISNFVAVMDLSLVLTVTTDSKSQLSKIAISIQYMTHSNDGD